ncbi:MAG: hypothetical protein FWB90_00605 [Fibromonadales bacterium]|nr:hypothetical protein [Fibromonadales bacterium]
MILQKISEMSDAEFFQLFKIVLVTTFSSIALWAWVLEDYAIKMLNKIKERFREKDPILAELASLAKYYHNLGAFEDFLTTKWKHEKFAGCALQSSMENAERLKMLDELCRLRRKFYEYSKTLIGYSGGRGHSVFWREK